MERSPAIGITVKTWPRRGRRRWPHYAVPTAYAEAVWRAGGVPFLLPNLSAAAHTFLDRIDGLLLSGGGDVHPKRYTEAPRHPSVYGVDPERDALEVALARAALERGMPVLAICRGVQVLNVALGGTLVQDIESEVPGALIHSTPDDDPSVRHPVDIAPSSLLARVLGATRLEVNTFHHQAVEQLGEGLCAVAQSPDGVVEGVEGEGRGFVLGVQWHPELLTSPHDRLFGAFVQAAARFALQGEPV